MTSADRDLDGFLPDQGDDSDSSEGSAAGSGRRRGPFGRRGGKSKRKNLPLWQETILLLGVALGLAILIKAVLVQAFFIPSESMEPGLVVNDRILVQKVSYWGGGTPQRGDVVVFKDPGGWLGPIDAEGSGSIVTKAMTRIGLYPAGGHLVKRVVGIEGDVIKCCDKLGRISVNGMPLDEEAYVKDAGTDCNGPMTGTCEWKTGPVPEDHIFVMGDNRGRSADSTVHLCTDDRTGCTPGDEFIAEDLVVGKVFVLLWPQDHFGWVSRPDAFADVPDTPGNE